MKNLILTFLILIVITIIFLGCEGSKETQMGETVKIGNQVWMTKNLDVDHFRNGDSIIEAKTEKEWVEAGSKKIPAWCYFNNDPNNNEKYGKLYNWYAVNDKRGLAPKGWHIPSNDEFNELIEFLGGTGFAGKKMKSKNGWINNGKTLFIFPKSGNGNNSSGFNGLPGGYRIDDGQFTKIENNEDTNEGFTLGDVGVWWLSSKNNDTNDIWNFHLNYFYDSVESYHTPIEELAESTIHGFSVRCVEGEALGVDSNVDDLTPENMGNIQATAVNVDLGEEVKIGDQIWMATNLNVDRFQNGEIIPEVKDSAEWTNLTTAAWCWYKNDSAKYGSIYGKLYNWYAIIDPRGLAPIGWHVPSNQEWYKLRYKAGSDWAGYDLKETGTSHWRSTDRWVTNESGFTGLPGGKRTANNSQPDFLGVQILGCWWSTENMGVELAEGYYMLDEEHFLKGTTEGVTTGLSVRLVKD
jgi:uncharacterized protein (TIGR02145 family)